MDSSSIHFKPLQALALSLRRRGILGTLRHSISFGMYRWRIWTWDLCHNVETRKPFALRDLEISSPNVRSGVHYEASDASVFKGLLGRLGIGYDDFTFVDVGSGKGKALLLASELPFKRIIGVEFSPELVGIAQRNCRSYHSLTQQCKDIETICMDVAEFTFPTVPLVLYFFDPIRSSDLMSELLNNIQQSAQRHPRPIFMVYYGGAHCGLYQRSSFLQPVSTAPRTDIGMYHLGWHIYKVAVPEAGVSVWEEASSSLTT